MGRSKAQMMIRRIKPSRNDAQQLSLSSLIALQAIRIHKYRNGREPEGTQHKASTTTVNEFKETTQAETTERRATASVARAYTSLSVRHVNTQLLHARNEHRADGTRLAKNVAKAGSDAASMTESTTLMENEGDKSTPRCAGDRIRGKLV